MSKWNKRTGIMLAYPMDEKNLRRNLLKDYGAICQPKLDGERCWCSWNGDGSVNLWSSEGNLFNCVPHINLALEQAYLGYPIDARPIFDGELYRHGWSFERIHSVVSRSVNLHKDYSLMQFHIFDLKDGAPQALRTESLASRHFSKISKLEREQEELKDILKLVPYYILYSQEDIEEMLWNFIESGYEGIIVRNIKGQYVERRSWQMLKYKPGKMDEYKIVGVVEAISEGGENYGRVGALICQDEEGTQFNVGCGKGVDHLVATELWNLRKEIIGKMARIQYQCKTDKRVPRFGKFIEVI